MSAGILPADHRTAAFNRQGKRGLCSRKTSAVAGRIDGRIRPLVSRLFTARAQTNHPSIYFHCGTILTIRLILPNPKMVSEVRYLD